MRNNFTTATRSLSPNEHSGIIAARILGVSFVGEHVAKIYNLPQTPALGPIGPYSGR